MASWTWVTWVSACLAFLMTSLLVTSRASLMWLLRLYKYEQIHPATWYTTAVMLLVTPHLTHLFKLVWDTPIISPANREKFPSLSKTLIGIFGSCLEGVATAVFATEVTPVLPEPALLTLPFATLAFYLMTTASRHFLKPRPEPMATKGQQEGPQPCLMRDFWYLITALYVLCVPVAVGVLLNLWSSFRFNIPESTAMIVALITLGGVWSPDVQKATITSKKSKNRCQMVEIIYVPFKIIGIVVTTFTCLLFKVKAFRQNMDAFLSAMLVDFSDFRVSFPVVLCITSGFLSLMCSIAASKMGLVTAGIKVPLFLCPVMSMFIVIAMWNDLQTDAFWELWGTDPLSWTAVGLSVLTWLIPFCFPAFRILKSPCKSGRDAMESLISFSWNSFFMEPKLILNYERCSIGKKCSCSSVAGKCSASTTSNRSNSAQRRKMAFICTTMYKENETEMRRYMNSIRDVILNHADETTDIEAHVFFDGSVEGGRINMRGRHLVSLLCETFDITFGQLQKNKTPYGCQIHTGSLLPHPVYIHFKDTAKVKAKKRWSQVMYLHYLLQFRCKSDFDRKASTVIEMKTDHKVDVNAVKGQKQDKCHESDMNKLNIDLAHKNNEIYINADVGREEFNDYANLTVYRRQTQKRSQDNADALPNCERNGKPYSLENNLHQMLNSCEGFKAPHGDDAGQQQKHKMNNGDVGFSSAVNENIEQQGAGSDEFLDIFTVTSHSPSSDQYSKGLHSTCLGNGWDASALENVFLLATDADTAFTAKSVQDVLSQCQKDPSLGAVCGRTVPEGSSKPIVWYQKFEYAKDFWLVKASQNVIGSVTCCPGCFSLYRASAVAQVAHEFSQPTVSAFDSMVKDHGEDRWLCTLLMQRGWRLAYSTHAHNSTHCPETVGEFLRQRRRWVLSELSNMAAIFMTLPRLVRHNQSFSATFIASLALTFMWVISSPATTLVFLCAGGDVIFHVSPWVTLPTSLCFFLAVTVVCCTMSQSRQKLAVMAATVVMVTAVMALSVGFILYVVHIMSNDIRTVGAVQFRPYFLVFLLVLAIIYAALLHPREAKNLVYGLSYAPLFPAMFVILPVYALANMVDQSWGTREVGTRGCCQQPQEEVDNGAFREFSIIIANLLNLSDRKESLDESTFWLTLKNRLIGVEVNTGLPAHNLSRDLQKLRCVCVSVFVFINLVWFVSLSLLHAYAGSDVICYLVASIFSFSLLVQLLGLTSHKCDSLIQKYLAKRNALNLTFHPGLAKI